MKTIYIILIFTISSISSLFAEDLLLHRNQFYVGPEMTHLERTKKGGARQDGSPIGVRGGYDRLKRYGWYIGLEGDYCWGKLQGHSIGEQKIRSNFSSWWGEGRFGYTFQQKCGWKASFTPFIGGGYLEEENFFISPSPISIHFKTKTPFACGGFLFWVPIYKNLEVGLNFKARFPLDLKCEVTHDPLHDDFEQLISERVQYRIDLPFTYRFSDSDNFAITFSPYWETRLYGSRINYPFDFLKTKFNFWGASLLLVWRL